MMAKANQKAREKTGGIFETWTVHANRWISKKKKNKRRGNN